MKIPVKNLNNETVKDLEVPEAVFAYPYKEHLIHLAVQSVLAGQRRGTHKVKVRHEVQGSGRKLWKQKGTGRARVGSIRSPLWRKGGVVHGPQPRSHADRLTPREKKNALRSVLSRKAAESQITVLDSLELDSHRTQDLAKALAGLGVDSKTLLVDRGENRNLELAARNNPNLKTVDALGVNVYDVLDRPNVVFSEQALERLVEVLTS